MKIRVKETGVIMMTCQQLARGTDLVLSLRDATKRLPVKTYEGKTCFATGADKGEYLIGLQNGAGDFTVYDIEVHIEPLDKGEPDNSFEKAHDARLDTPYPIRFVPFNDADFFRLSVPEAGILSWQVKDWPAEEAQCPVPLIGFFDADFKFVDGEETHVRVSAGTYYAVARPNKDKTFRTVFTPSTITFSFQKETHPLEPNDRFSTASPVVFGKPMTTSFFPRLDKDYFVLTVPEDGVVGATFINWDKGPDGPERPIINFYDSNQKLIYSRWYEIPVVKGRYYALLAYAYDISDARMVEKPFQVTFHFQSQKEVHALNKEEFVSFEKLSDELITNRWIFRIERTP
jgi:hypothetical protein